MDFMAFFDKNRVAIVRKPYHLAFCIFNFIIPGSGTMLSALPRFSEYSRTEFNWAIFIDGVLQQFLSIVIFGYVWSCWTGITLYKKRMEVEPIII